MSLLHTISAGGKIAPAKAGASNELLVGISAGGVWASGIAGPIIATGSVNNTTVKLYTGFAGYTNYLTHLYMTAYNTSGGIQSGRLQLYNSIGGLVLDWRLLLLNNTVDTVSVNFTEPVRFGVGDYINLVSPALNLVAVGNIYGYNIAN